MLSWWWILALIKYLKDSFLDSICLNDVYYFSSICIEGARTNIFSCVLREQKENKKE